ncbi:MAG: M56 family metallopeptidase [Dethiobacter sp.]|nr:M56 family metallopeptidase [Dethiobacter sp.]MCL4462509.1 M56 family metallopeptidase [Bacillota bacterium]MCL5993564.1 M56 family metallopeptidase [Bacillota bacterium]
MRVSDLHSFFIYVFFGYFFIFPALYFALKLFNIRHPQQRKRLYMMVLLVPFAGFALYHTVLEKRCQTGLLPGGLFLVYFDALCNIGKMAISFLAPLLVLLMVIGLLKALAGSLYLWRTQASSVEPSKEERHRVESIIRSCCREWQLAVPPVFFTGQKGFAAFAAGFYRPAVVINTAILPQLTDAELAGILIHELVHIRRKDMLMGWLLHLLRDMMIFTPFSTILLDRYMLERERLCDLETAEVLGSQRQYAATLLKVWRLLLDRQQFRPGFAANFTGKKREMEQRVMALLAGNEQKAALPGYLFLTLLFSMATLTILFLGLIC